MAKVKRKVMIQAALIKLNDGMAIVYVNGMTYNMFIEVYPNGLLKYDLVQFDGTGIDIGIEIAQASDGFRTWGQAIFDIVTFNPTLIKVQVR